MAESEGLTGYDASVRIKDIIYDLFTYLLDSFNPYGVWDGNHVLLIARSARPNTTAQDANRWTAIVREAICEELNVPPKGYRLWLNVKGDFIRFIPYRDQEYENALHRVSWDL